MKTMSEREFSLYRKLIYSNAGICLTPPKKALLEARLGRRLRELGLESFLDYYQRVTTDPTGHELVQLLDRVTTNETHFFREPRQFEFLEHVLCRIGELKPKLDCGRVSCASGAPVAPPAKNPIR